MGIDRTSPTLYAHPPQHRHGQPEFPDHLDVHHAPNRDWCRRASPPVSTSAIRRRDQLTHHPGPALAVRFLVRCVSKQQLARKRLRTGTRWMASNASRSSVKQVMAAGLLPAVVVDEPVRGRPGRISVGASRTA
jgi:hypothetical protein